MPKLLRDALERIAWTAAQTAVATAIVVIPDAGLPTWTIPVIAAALAGLKARIARHIGNADSASTLPGI